MSEALVTLHARAWFLGSRIDVRQIEAPVRLGQNPLVLPADDSGYAARGSGAEGSGSGSERLGRSS